MKTLFLLLAAFAIAAVVLWLAASAPSLQQTARVFRKTRVMAFNALTDGISPNRCKSFLADAAQSTRHLLYKVGSDAGHVAVISAASDKPLGWSEESPEAAEESQKIQLFGGPHTVLAIAGATLAANVQAYSKGNGRIMGTPTTAGTYWLVGTTATASTDGVEIEIIPLANPQKVVVLANGSTLSQMQAVMLDGAIPHVLAA